MKKRRVFTAMVVTTAILLIVFTFIQDRMEPEMISIQRTTFSAADVCPPFHLYDEEGNLIDPVNGVNSDKPYSPRQTCGKCHDYELIMEGYHFQQGADEEPTETMRERFQWVSSPGNYGGSWCSPAPLYRYLSPKENSSAATMDMTSFTFLTSACGNCHPGGGPAEYDRYGNRYDLHMLEKGYVSGGINDYDGDYYRARWTESGVIEGDCMICHQPGYDNEERIRQRSNLNFRWAATAASGWARVDGAVKNDEEVTVQYDLTHFDKEGRLSPQIVKEPRNESCLLCHAQPGWKKRGANYSHRTDVHLRAGLKCVDCHPAGSMALDERINQREMHQIGKGDDPGGNVRNDLNNTMLTCNHCHTTGHMGAPVARHEWLPALHLDRIACQSCHIPERLVKPSQVQASDVFNPGTKIPTAGKHLWVFYGPDMRYYNHYGNLEMMGYDDKPTDPFRPILVRYNGQIRPANRVHSAWPGLEAEGKPGLMQPRMSDVYKMWQDHFKDPLNYPELALITDDNGDGVIEINSPKEIEAIISAVGTMLEKINFPMEGKRVVWVMNDRVYTDGSNYYKIEKEPWEASPYANVHTYNHDIYPARAALGSNGCTDCHSSNAGFYSANVLQYPFDENAQPVYQPQYEVLQISHAAVWMGNFRETWLKPLSPWIIVAFISLLLLHFVLVGKKRTSIPDVPSEQNLVYRFKVMERLPHFFVMLSFLFLGITGFLFFLGKSDPTPNWVRDLHGWMGWIFIFSLIMLALLWIKHMIFSKDDRTWMKSFGGYFDKNETHLPAGKFNAGQKLFYWLILFFGLILALTGVLMFTLQQNHDFNLSIIYTLHNLSALIVLIMVLAHVYLGVVLNAESLNSIFGGYVKINWLKVHHPNFE